MTDQMNNGQEACCSEKDSSYVDDGVLNDKPSN